MRRSQHLCDLTKRLTSKVAKKLPAHNTNRKALASKIKSIRKSSGKSGLSSLMD